MTPAAVAYPPLYASGGPAGGQTVAFDPREQGDGLRPKPLPHSGSVGSFQGRQGPGLRPSPGRPVSSLRCGPRQPPLRPLTPFPLEKRTGSATAARRAVLGVWHNPGHPKTGKRAVGPFLAALPKWSRAAGGKLRFSFDGWPTTSRRRGVSTVFHQKRAADRAAVRYENRLCIVLYSCIVSYQYEIQ